MFLSLIFLIRAVHVTDFTSGRYQILTASDDYSCRLWDIPNAMELTTFREHADYIRCGVTSKLNSDLFITGEMESERCIKNLYQIIDAPPQLIGNKYLTEGFKSVRVKLKTPPRPPGSYDHAIKLFDARVNKSAMTMDHGQPVESLLLYPSEGLLVSAGRKSCCQTNHAL